MVEIGAKMGVRMGAILPQMVQNGQTQGEKETSRKHAQKSHPKHDNYMPSEPRFRGPRLDESSVHCFGPWLKNVSKMVLKNILNGGLDGALGAKMLAGEAFITHAQTRHQTATKYSQKMTPK